MLYLFTSYAIPMVWAVMSALFPAFVALLPDLTPIITIVSMGLALYGFTILRTEGAYFRKAQVFEILLIVINLISITFSKNNPPESYIVSHGTLFIVFGIVQMALSWYMKFLTGQSIREMERHRNIDIGGKALEKVILIEITVLTLGYIFLHIYAPIGLLLSLLALIANAVAVYFLYKTYIMSRKIPGIK